MLPTDNPFAAPSELPLQFPPFDRIREEHYRPAIEQAMAEHRAEIEAIGADPAPPTFANTLEALERSGRLLDRVLSVFYNLVSSDSTDPTPRDRGSRCRRGSPRTRTRSTLDAAALRPDRRACTAARTGSGSSPSSCGCWSATTPTSCGPAPAGRAGPGNGCGR